MSAGSVNCIKSNVNGDSVVNNSDALAVRGKYGCTNKSSVPVITGVSGPSTLKIGETGTWGVKAYDPSGGSLTYSVVWGDEVRILVSQTPGDDMISLPLQTATFSHSYSNPGSYIPKFYVMNSSGKWAQTSLSVRVGEVNQTGVSLIVQPNPNLGIKWDPSDGGEAALSSTFHVAVTNNSNETVYFYKKQTPVKLTNTTDSNFNHFSYGRILSSDLSVSAIDNNVINDGDAWGVPVGKTITFVMQTSFNPKTMFAGVYKASLDRLIKRYVWTADSTDIGAIVGQTVYTNSVTVVGEKSPYVTWVDVAKDNSLMIKGERFNQVTQAIVVTYQGGMVVVPKANFSNITDTSIGISYGDLNRPAGSYYVYLVSPTGDSNKIGFTMGGVTDASITVLSPNGGEILELGKTYRIRWSTNGYPNTANVQLGLYDTRYSTEGGAYPEITIANQPNWGFYDWAIPSNLNRDFGGSATTAYHKIKVYSRHMNA